MRRLPPNFHGYQHGGVAPPAPLLMAPAMALLPLVRWPLGYQTLSLFSAFRRAGLLLLVPMVGWFVWRQLTGQVPPANEGRLYLSGFVAATFLVTLLRFLRRVVGQYTGEEIHQAEAGYSPLAHALPFAMPLIEQLAMPGLLGWVGWHVAQSFSVDLGWWLLACAGSYFAVANWEQRNRMAQRRAPVDDKIQAGVFAGNVERHEERATAPKSARGKGAPYGPGAAPDIVELGRGVRRRRR